MIEQAEKAPVITVLQRYNDVIVCHNPNFTRGTIVLYDEDGNMIASLFDIAEIHIGGPSE